LSPYSSSGLEFDSAIVRELVREARFTNRELANQLGIAPSTCLVRTRFLRQRGVITGFHAEVDLRQLDRGVQTLITAQIRPLNRTVIEGFKAFAMTLPEVLLVYVVAGDDFLVHVAVRDVDSLNSFLMDNFTERREVVGFRSSIVYQHARRLPIPP
jgi:DNA-binding Lrp family transcriptional regulator